MTAKPRKLAELDEVQATALEAVQGGVQQARRAAAEVQQNLTAILERHGRICRELGLDPDADWQVKGNEDGTATVFAAPQKGNRQRRRATAREKKAD